MEIISTTISGCVQIFPKIFTDPRGAFIKTFHREVFVAWGLDTRFVEEYYSVSRKGVLRGLHFQIPPMDHTKLVYCINGEVIDAIVDLRIGSPTYGQHALFELRGDIANMLYIPPGLAHGFYTKSDKAIMMYKTTTVYSPEHDRGILWSSVGIPWPDERPVVSARDKAFPPLTTFLSPFTYTQNHG